MHFINGFLVHVPLFLFKWYSATLRPQQCSMKAPSKTCYCEEKPVLKSYCTLCNLY